MFGSGAKAAVQDPSYPAYVDSAVMIGQTGGYSDTGYEGIEYMVCRPENDFFPDLSQVQQASKQREQPTPMTVCSQSWFTFDIQERS